MGFFFRIVLLKALILSVLYANGQVIENVRSALNVDQDYIIIQYDLISEIDNETFNVIPYVVFPDSTTRIYHVSGDVGKGITPGKSKRIEWDFDTEIDFFVGSVSFLIAPEYMFPISEEHSKLKRGRIYNFDLPEGFNRGYKLFLYNYRKKTAKELPFHFYEDHLEITCPRKTNTGKYQLLFKSNSSDQEIYTRPIKIKRKVPFFLYTIPFIGYGAYYAFTTATEASRDLPEPPTLNDGFTK